VELAPPWTPQKRVKSAEISVYDARQTDAQQAGKAGAAGASGSGSTSIASALHAYKSALYQEANSRADSLFQSLGAIVDTVAAS
jgi:hypothetical protein